MNYSTSAYVYYTTHPKYDFKKNHYNKSKQELKC